MRSEFDPDDRLEQLIERVLREQPLRRAPRSLQLRVLAEIERRGSAAWWRTGFARWPLAARLAFLVVSMFAASLAVTVMAWLFAGFSATSVLADAAREAGWIRTVAGALVAVLDSIPPLVLWGALGLIGAMYIVLFGISAFAYRVLYAGR